MEAELLDVGLLVQEVPLFAETFAVVAKQFPEASPKSQFNEAIKRVVDFLATDLIQQSNRLLKGRNIGDVGQIRSCSVRLAQFSKAAAEGNASLRRFLFTHIYDHPSITEDRDRSVQCLEELFLFYLARPGSMPQAHEALVASAPRHVVVCDYIAGMTDQFLLRQHRENLA